MLTIRRSVCLFSKAICMLMITSIFIFAGCYQEPKGSFSSRRLGVGFDFPKGWSRLSSDEMKKMFPGQEDCIVTIGDRDRIAIVSLVEAYFDREEICAINYYSNLARAGAKSGDKSASLTEAENKLAAFYAVVLASINKALHGRYENSRMLRKGGAAFGGMLVGEIVFEGRMRPVASHCTQPTSGKYISTQTCPAVVFTPFL